MIRRDIHRSPEHHVLIPAHVSVNDLDRFGQVSHSATIAMVERAVFEYWTWAGVLPSHIDALRVTGSSVDLERPIRTAGTVWVRVSLQDARRSGLTLDYAVLAEDEVIVHSVGRMEFQPDSNSAQGDIVVDLLQHVAPMASQMHRAVG